MKRKTALAVGIAAAAGVGVAVLEVVRGRSLHVRLDMERETTLSPEAVIGAAVQVEREAGVIPYVRRVEVLERNSGWVRYKVFGSTYRIPWWVQYRKAWDYEAGIVKWASEKSSYGIRNSGRLTITKHGDVNHVRLETGYSVHRTGVGHFMESAMRSVLNHALGKWLDAITTEHRL